MPHLEAPQYTWICQYCSLSSPGGTLHCANCGFPAHTSAFELQRAKDMGSIEDYLADRRLRENTWRRKPLWKKTLVVAAVLLFAAGVNLVGLASGWKSMALGAAAIAASLLLLWLGG